MSNTNGEKSDTIVVELNGDTLTPEQLQSLANPKNKIRMADNSWKRIADARKFIEAECQRRVVYGVNTGFGSLANVEVQAKDLALLQVNLIRAHACGVGEPLPLNLSRMVFALRINVLAKGCSGAREETVKRMIDAFNKNCVPLIPSQGTVGASGDLVPLSHIALGLMGEGMMWDDTTNTYKPAAEVLKAKGCEPIELKLKEGLALINGTQFITALATEALLRAEKAWASGVIIAALSMKSLQGLTACLDPKVHLCRAHPGQIEVASLMRQVMQEEEVKLSAEEEKKKEEQLVEWAAQYKKFWGLHEGSSTSSGTVNKVQDGYTIRCAPQVYGVVVDTLRFAREILTRELNSATDNPLIFSSDGIEGSVISGGNFHGQYPAKAADIIAMAIHDVAMMSERRIYRLTTTHLSGLPPFLLPKEAAGLNSGFMIPQYVAAALASEDKVLVHPSSSDSVPTCAGQEDHVSMGGWAARKALQVVGNVEKILGIELMAACQACEFLPVDKKEALSRTPLWNVYKTTREVVPKVETDRWFSPEMQKCAELVKDGTLLLSLTEKQVSTSPLAVSSASKEK